MPVRSDDGLAVVPADLVSEPHVMPQYGLAAAEAGVDRASAARTLVSARTIRRRGVLMAGLLGVKRRCQNPLTPLALLWAEDAVDHELLSISLAFPDSSTGVAACTPACRALARSPSHSR